MRRRQRTAVLEHTNVTFWTHFISGLMQLDLQFGSPVRDVLPPHGSDTTANSFEWVEKSGKRFKATIEEIS